MLVASIELLVNSEASVSTSLHATDAFVHLPLGTHTVGRHATSDLCVFYENTMMSGQWRLNSQAGPTRYSQ